MRRRQTGADVGKIEGWLGESEIREGNMIGCWRKGGKAAKMKWERDKGGKWRDVKEVFERQSEGQIEGAGGERGEVRERVAEKEECRMLDGGHRDGERKRRR